jgi:hypothetical protein
VKYRDIQPAHEQSVLDSFAAYLKIQDIELQILDRPDPPDAIVKIQNRLCWIEITDAFQTQQLAMSITSDGAEDRPYIPYESEELLAADHNDAFEIVLEVILKKYQKPSMIELLETHGRGILLVGAYTPLTSPEEIIEQDGDLILAEIADKPSVFESIYLYSDLPDGFTFFKLF